MFDTLLLFQNTYRLGPSRLIHRLYRVFSTALLYQTNQHGCLRVNDSCLTLSVCLLPTGHLGILKLLVRQYGKEILEKQDKNSTKPVYFASQEGAN